MFSDKLIGFIKHKYNSEYFIHLVYCGFLFIVSDKPLSSTTFPRLICSPFSFAKPVEVLWGCDSICKLFDDKFHSHDHDKLELFVRLFHAFWLSKVSKNKSSDFSPQLVQKNVNEPGIDFDFE